MLLICLYLSLYVNEYHELNWGFTYFIRITSPKSEFEFRYFEMKSDEEADEKFSEKNAVLLINKMCENHCHREKEPSSIESKHFYEIL